jgi:hypothetical protein
MMEREIKNARIRSTTLGWEDHGIFTAFVDLEYDGSGQGFGGYALDEWRGERNATGKRFGTSWGMEFIMRVCEIVGVKRWEELPGKYVRADADSGKVYRVGHITADKWFDPAELSSIGVP